MADAYRDDLAHIHDAGFGALARAAAPVLLDDLRRRGVRRGLVIDLGCGSGLLSAELAAAGYDVLGIDQSPAFIDLARRRVPGGRFAVGSLWTVELPPCAAVAAVGECVNYQFDGPHPRGALAGLFGRAFAALSPGGPLLLDAAEPGRVPGPGASKTWTEGDGWAVLVTADEDPQHELLTRRITSFRRAGELYRRDHEVHTLRLWPRAEVAVGLRAAGFEVQALDGYRALPFAPGHVGFLARKPGPAGAAAGRAMS